MTLAVPTRVGDYARYCLAAVRLFNGTAGLVAPGFLIRQLGSDPATNPAAVYAFRLFGIRTILIGADLLVLRGEERKKAVRNALIIHGSDTATAASLAFSGKLPGRAGPMITTISGLNVVLSVLARAGSR